MKLQSEHSRLSDRPGDRERWHCLRRGGNPQSPCRQARRGGSSTGAYHQPATASDAPRGQVRGGRRGCLFLLSRVRDQTSTWVGATRCRSCERGDLFDAVAAIKRGQANTKGLLAKMNQSSWADAVVTLCDFFVKAQAQPALPRLLEHEGLQGVPPELTPYTVIIDPQTNFPIRLNSFLDGTIFKMPIIDFQAWLRISYDDTRAFLAGDAKHKAAASDASDPHHPPRHLRLRTLRAKVVRLETTLGLKKNRIEKCLAMLRKNKAMLSEPGGMRGSCQSKHNRLGLKNSLARVCACSFLLLPYVPLYQCGEGRKENEEKNNKNQM